MKRKRDKDYFQAICGINPRKPMCYLLHFEGFNILLDCGLPIKKQDKKKIKSKLSKIASTLDVILLSHSSFSNICGLPILAELPECKAQIFATEPTNKMGEMTMYDYYINLSKVADFLLDETLNKVDDIFKRIKELKYSETHVVKREDRNQVMRIQPFNSGHNLGGTVWKITNDIDTIVYCVDYDIKQTNYLNGMDMRVFETKPTLLILDSRTVEGIPKKSEQQIVEIIKKTVKEGNGNILIPSDTSGRALELVCLLEGIWRSDPEFSNVRLIFLTNMSKRTVNTYASQMLGFMSDDVNDQFMKRRVNPFNLRKCKLSQKLSDLSEMSSNVVIASSEDLELGFARDVFLKWVQNERNSVILTEFCSPGTLSHRLAQFLIRNKNLPADLELTHRSKEALSGEAFEIYKQKKMMERQEELKRKQEEAARKQTVMIRDEDQQGVDLMVGDPGHADLMRDEGWTGPGHFGMGLSRDGRNLENHHPRLFLPENMIYRSRFLMFPPKIEEEVENDVFGEIVDVDKLKEISIKMLEQDTHLDDDGDDKSRKKKKKRRRKVGMMRRGLIGDSDDEDEEDEDEGEDVMKDEDDEEDPMSAQIAARRRRMMMTTQATPKEIEAPMVVVEKVIRIQLRAQFHFVSYEGRANRDSVRNILNKVTPQQLILVHGDSREKERLRKYCMRQRICKSVICAKSMDKIQVMSERVVFQVKLAVDLVQNLKNFGSFEIGYFEGEYMLPDFQSEEKEEEKKVDESENGDDVDVDDLTGKNEIELKKEEEYPIIMKRDKNLGHTPIFIGDIPLNEFKDMLNRRGITTQFKFGGGLICNNVVLITKDANRKIGVHGPLCKEYFLIRKILYEQYNIL